MAKLHRFAASEATCYHHPRLAAAARPTWGCKPKPPEIPARPAGCHIATGDRPRLLELSVFCLISGKSCFQVEARGVFQAWLSAVANHRNPESWCRRNFRRFGLTPPTYNAPPCRSGSLPPRTYVACRHMHCPTGCPRSAPRPCQGCSGSGNRPVPILTCKFYFR